MATETMSHDKFVWHLDVAVCRTLQGAATHVGLLSIDDRWGLCWHLRVSDAALLPRRLYQAARDRRQAA